MKKDTNYEELLHSEFMNKFVKQNLNAIYFSLGIIIGLLIWVFIMLIQIITIIQ
jgi:hypothetical protein